MDVKRNGLKDGKRRKLCFNMQNCILRWYEQQTPIGNILEFVVYNKFPIQKLSKYFVSYIFGKFSLASLMHQSFNREEIFESCQKFNLNVYAFAK